MYVIPKRQNKIDAIMILVTNDDGESEGLRMLVEAATRFDKKAVTIMPNRQRSAISKALTLHKPLRLQKTGADSYSLNGTPADCVLFSIYSEEFEKPDFILSGINWWDNAGLGPLMGSGTLGACWQAALEGIPSIAFSLHREGHDWHNKDAWGDKEKIIEKVTEIIELLRPKLGPDKFLSVNLPGDLSSAKIIHTNNLQRKRYTTKIEKRQDPNEVPYFWTYGIKEKPKQGTDLYEVAVNKNITVTEISIHAFENK